MLNSASCFKTTGNFERLQRSELFDRRISFNFNNKSLSSSFQPFSQFLASPSHKEDKKNKKRSTQNVKNGNMNIMESTNSCITSNTNPSTSTYITVGRPPHISGDSQDNTPLRMPSRRDNQENIGGEQAGRVENKLSTSFMLPLRRKKADTCGDYNEGESEKEEDEDSLDSDKKLRKIAAAGNISYTMIPVFLNCPVYHNSYSIIHNIDVCSQT